ncbi:MAG: dihydropteroate synthase [Pirellulaceae bacterium]
MGIVNVTPDSFSDGGRFADPSQAIDHALQMVEEGADIIDIGGESTRPYSSPIEQLEELRRVIPVVEGVRARTDVPISIDTTKSQVAREALAAGAEIINDISGLEADPGMLQVAIDSRAAICAMHMQGTPQTMQDDPRYDDVVEDIRDYLAGRLSTLIRRGIDPESVCLDPGIGFGKSHQHNLDLLAACDRYHELGSPLLVGHSRKGFMAKILADRDRDRTLTTVAVSLHLARLGVQVIRVHDVRFHSEAVRMFAACGGVDGISGRIA